MLNNTKEHDTIILHETETTVQHPQLRD